LDQEDLLDLLESLERLEVLDRLALLDHRDPGDQQENLVKLDQ